MKNFFLKIAFAIFNYISFAFALFAALEVFGFSMVILLSLATRDIVAVQILKLFPFFIVVLFFLSWIPYIIARKLWLMIDDDKKPKWISILCRKNVYEIWTSKKDGPIARFLQLGSYVGPKSAPKKEDSAKQETVAKQKDVTKQSEHLQKGQLQKEQEEKTNIVSEPVYDDMSAYDIDASAVNIEADSAYDSSVRINGLSVADAEAKVLQTQIENREIGEKLQIDSKKEEIRKENFEYEEMLIALDIAADNLEPGTDTIETETGQRKLVEMASKVFGFIAETECVDFSDSYYLKLGEAFIGNKKETGGNLNRYLSDADRWDLLGAYKALRYFKSRCCSYEEETVEEYKKAVVQELLYRMQLIDEGENA